MALKVLEKIEEVSKVECPSEEEQIEEIPKTKFLFFFVGKTKYAVRESQLSNVLRDSRLFGFPFAPKFIDGVVNCHNQICPAVNLQKLLGNSSCEAMLPLYLVMKTESDPYALRVSSIDDFFMVPDEVYVENSDEQKDEFVQAYLHYDEEQIPVLNVMAINDSIVSACKGE